MLCVNRNDLDIVKLGKLLKGNKKAKTKKKTKDKIKYRILFVFSCFFFAMNKYHLTLEK